MTLVVRWANPPKEPVDNKLFDVRNLEAKRGFLITGHPGAGKTSTMIYLGQQLGGHQAQKLALTPHEEDAPKFQEAGFACITDIPQITKQIGLLDEEIKLRASDSSRRFKLVIAIDELGRVLDSDDKADDLMETVRHIAVEGRKLEVIVLVGNHSQTTKAIKMDGEFRSSFYQLFLVGAARYAIKQPGREIELKKWEKDWVSEAAYPCLALINGQYKVCKHPTHHEYPDYKDSGNPPLNLEKWDVNPLTIKLAPGCQHLAQKEDRQYQFSFSEDEFKVIEYAQKKGDWVTVKGLANTAYFRKERGLNLSDVRQIVEALNRASVITIDSAAKPSRYRIPENQGFATAAENGYEV
jgi:DNA polymerase III delta prime subunit